MSKKYKLILEPRAQQGIEKICRTGDRTLVTQIGTALESIQKDPLQSSFSVIIVSGYDLSVIQTIRKYCGHPVEGISVWKNSSSGEDLDLRLSQLEIGLYETSLFYQRKRTDSSLFQRCEQQEQDLILSDLRYYKGKYRLRLSVEKERSDIIIYGARISLREMM